MLASFDHVTIRVRELDSALQAYQRLFHCAPIWRGEQQELAATAAVFGLANGALELLAPAGEGLEAEGLWAQLHERGEGVSAVALGTLDADQLSRSLRARGIRATQPQAGEARSGDGTARRYRTVELSPRATRGLSVFAVERADLAELYASAPALPDAVAALDHVVVRTADPDSAIALYRDGLGMRLALDRQFRGVRMLFFRLGGVTLEFVHDPSLDAHDVFHGVAYRVRDLDAAHARMRAAGFELGELRHGSKAGTRVYTVRSGTAGVRTLIVRDPARDA